MKLPRVAIRRQRGGLRPSLIASFLLLFLLFVVLDALLMQRSQSELEDRVARRVLQLETGEVRESLERLQETAEFVLRETADHRDDLAAARFGDVNIRLMTLMKMHPAVSSVNYGDADGNGFLLLREGRRWRNRIKRAADPGVVTWVELDPGGGRRAEERLADDYDPRLRPWYRDAMGVAGIVWSRPYIFRTTRDLGLTASLAIPGGVLGADVMLTDLSGLLQHVTVHSPGLVVGLVSSDGSILASSDEASFMAAMDRGKAELPTLGSAGFEVLREAWGALARDGVDYSPLRLSGRRNFAFREKLLLSGFENHYLLAVSTVPEAFPPILSWQKTILFLLVMVLAATLYTKVYLLPIRWLTEKVRDFVAGGSIPPPAGGRLDEVGVLSEAVSTMATELRARYDSLAQAQERYTRLHDGVQDGIYAVDRDGVILSANPAFAAMFGFASPEAFVGRNLRESWVDPGERDAMIARLEREGAIVAHRFRGRRFDGSEGLFEVSNVLVRDEKGQAAGVDGIVRDITEREATTAIIRKSAEEWQRTFDAMTDHVSVHDREYRIVRANRAMGEYFGVHPRELVGKRCFELYHGTALPHADCPFTASLHSGENASTEIEMSGGGVPFQVTVSLLHSPDGEIEGCVHVARDISEHRRMEAEILQNRKMESVGQLAGGIAHDFNNILATIVGFAHLGKFTVPEEHPLRGSLDDILSAADRGKVLTQGLLAFSRKQILQRRVIDLNEAVRDAEKLLRRLIGEDIELVTVFSPRALPVLADPGQLAQVLMNLATNARDAMPRGGRLLIETRDLKISGSDGAALGVQQTGDYSQLTVTDTGRGMSREALEQAFEPFFTTKELGRGTGLGLATAYGIVRQHEGHISISSDPGKGTAVSILLPIVNELPAAPSPLSAVVDAGLPPGGTETILLAEDDAQLRKLATIVFSGAGYTVLAAADGAEAIELLRERGGVVDLLVLDVLMPKNNGCEVLAAARQERPEIRALFLSGYTADVIRHRGLLEEGLEFMMKPVLPSDLLRRVRQILDG